MKTHNITVLSPESEFADERLLKLKFAGTVTFMDSKRQSSLKDLIKISKNADIIAFNPDEFGKYASRYLSEILKASPNVKGLALNTNHADYVDMEYCRERGIKVVPILDYTAEAVAEHVILLLLGCAKRLFINDRRTYRRRYQPELGFEIRGRTLGVIGTNQEAQRVMQLAGAMGMIVYTTERSEWSVRQPFVFHNDMITIHLPNTEENKKFLSKEKINRLKEGTIVINLSGRELVHEGAMSEALKSGKVAQYAFEAESLHKSPLEGIETALMFKPFSRLTRESVARNRYEWVRNIANLAGHHTS
jgi:phosphoglycerate dehydrogenase-like enzyme